MNHSPKTRVAAASIGAPRVDQREGPAEQPAQQQHPPEPPVHPVVPRTEPAEQLQWRPQQVDRPKADVLTELHQGLTEAFGRAWPGRRAGAL
jgi:hypothetical protein